uniref:DUF4283 domain-containing protein n=1 Tax=Cannabis sativa TaxID=3483 RepID=A0A803PEY4_CANSA
MGDSSSEQNIEGDMEELRLQFIEEASLELEADFEINTEIAKTGLEDKEEVLKRRPWILAGQLLNIREWPLDGNWYGVPMNKAVFWVEIHGLPTPYLAFQNSSVIGAKVGEFLASDGVDNRTIARRGFLKLKVDIHLDQRLPAGFYLSISRGRKEWIRFKYRELPKTAFNRGYLAHDSSVCTGAGACLSSHWKCRSSQYGPWIKANVPIRNCFDTKRPVLLRDGEDRTANIQAIRRVQVSNEGPSTGNGTRIGVEATTTIDTHNCT